MRAVIAIMDHNALRVLVLGPRLGRELGLSGTGVLGDRFVSAGIVDPPGGAVIRNDVYFGHASPPAGGWPALGRAPAV